jgi:diguanylate cyclase (GGDEF)-like protein
MSILIVDDSADMRESLQMVLEAEGFTDVYTAASPQAAFQLLGLEGNTDHPPPIDVILMDILMPQGNGVEACRRLKQHPRTVDIPILMITGQSQDGVLAAAFDAGAADYITKPIKPVELVARLRSALTLKHELDARRSREQDLLRVTHQLQEANQQLQRLSDQDALTGVANRRSFDTHLAYEWSRAAREQTPLALIMIDIDYFKAFNDHYGHPHGDECLKQVAQALAGPLKRPGDLLARYGGEEFIILLPWTGLPGAMALAERLRNRVTGLRIPHRRSAAADHVTISLGVACDIPTRQATPQELIEAADQGLYAAKEKGRDRIEVVGPQTDARRLQLHH